MALLNTWASQQDQATLSPLDRLLNNYIQKGDAPLAYLMRGDAQGLLKDLNTPKPVNTTQDMTDLALNLVGSINPMGNVTKGLLSKTQFEKAQEIASKNAETLLGLPKGNTAMDRAKAMGYDTPAYHGTNADILSMNVAGKGKTSGAGAFVTNNPLVAETYLSGIGTPGGNIMPLLIKDKDLLTANAKGRNWADIWTDTLSVKSGNKKYSLDDLGLDKYSATTTDELGMIANELGKKGIKIGNVRDVGPNSHIFRAKDYLYEKYGVYPNEDWSNITGNQFAEARDWLDNLYKSQKSTITSIQDPSLIRSQFAAFDPAKANEPDLLAATLAIPVSGLLEQPKDKKKKK
jgi:hypothetical protein